MSTLSSIEDATKNFFGSSASGVAAVAGGIDIAKVLDVVNAIIAAAPAIEAGIATATPFVEAICEMIANGGKPTDDQWTALRAKLDAGSATLANAEAQAQAELDAQQAGEAPNGPDGGPAQTE